MIVDFHSHVLPGIDDGSRDAQTSEKILKESKEQGITHLLATPHFYADESSIDGFLASRNAAYETVKNMYAPEIVLGAEIAFFQGISESSRIAELATGNVLMIEMPFRNWRESDIEEIETLLERGFELVIAHIERFITRENRTLMSRLLQLPIFAQVNCEAIIDLCESDKLELLQVATFDDSRGKQRLFRRKSEEPLFYEGVRYVLGSDTHSLHRRPQNMKRARTIMADNNPELLELIDANSELLLEMMG